MSFSSLSHCNIPRMIPCMECCSVTALQQAKALQGGQFRRRTMSRYGPFGAKLVKEIRHLTATAVAATS